MAPGRNSYRIANAAFDARARRLGKPRKEREIPFLWGMLVGAILSWGLLAVVAEILWRLI